MEDVIRSGQGSATRLREMMAVQGGGSLLEDGIRKIRRGDTSVAEVAQTVGLAG